MPSTFSLSTELRTSLESPKEHAFVFFFHPEITKIERPQHRSFKFNFKKARDQNRQLTVSRICKKKFDPETSSDNRVVFIYDGQLLFLQWSTLNPSNLNNNLGLIDF